MDDHAFLGNALFDTKTGARIDRQGNQEDQRRAPENPAGKPDAKPGR